MIKINEVRIGNWVTNSKGDIFQIDTEAFFLFHQNKEWDCQPIPLTEDWLLKFGFEYKEWKSFSENLNKNLDNLACGYVINRVYCFLMHENKLAWFGRRNTRSWKEGNDRWNFTEYGLSIYVHQLQNLYFSIIESDLEIEKELIND